MSGGVDSSVAAALLTREGYNVIGITMKLWDFREVGGNKKREATCCTIETMNDARDVCQSLGIPHYVVDFRQDFRRYVVEDFISEYLTGRTPNPCINCNVKIKWATLLRKARELGADYMATGHYAQLGYEETEERYFIRKAVDESKDQSYALWGLTQSNLSQTILPLGSMKKTEVRALAAEMGLKTAEKVESQEICFVPDNDYRRLLQDRLAQTGDKERLSGEIVTTDGKPIGRHQAYTDFTLGQRRGLGIALGRPAYVVDIDPKSHRVTVGDRDALLKQALRAGGINWMGIKPIDEPERLFVKIRYRDPGDYAMVFPEEEGYLKVEFEKPQWAITPGQSAVFYNDDRVAGGGIIIEGLNPVSN